MQNTTKKHQKFDKDRGYIKALIKEILVLVFDDGNEILGESHSLWAYLYLLFHAKGRNVKMYYV